jgi:hypothetical protein
MPDPAKQHFPPGKVKVIIAGYAEGYTDYSHKRE